MNPSTMTRRKALVSVCASATAIAANPKNALADSAGPPDPIFAAIEAYNRARAVWSDAAGIRAVIIDNGPDKEPADVIARAAAAERAAWGPKEAAGIALIKVRPTTIAGCIALLRYAYERSAADSQEFPEWIETGERNAAGEELGDTWQNLLLEHVAEALAEIAGAA